VRLRILNLGFGLDSVCLGGAPVSALDLFLHFFKLFQLKEAIEEEAGEQKR